MSEILIRFAFGGAIVSAFAVLGDVLEPKSFAGLFGAAPSVALASLILAISSKGPSFAATEMRSTIAGAIAFLIYATLISRIMMHNKMRTTTATLALLPVWLICAFAIYFAALR